MKVPSRRMPRSAAVASLPVAGRVVLPLAFCVVVWLLWTHPAATLGVVAALVLAGLVLSAHVRRRLARLAASRGAESICSFTRALPIRDLDPWVVRAVYEETQEHLRDVHPEFPLRPSDRFLDDLHIDPEDVEADVAVRAAARAGRELGSAPQTIVSTLEDLIRYLCAQPKGRITMR